MATTDKQIRVTGDTWKLCDKLARKLSKTMPATIYMGTAITIALREYAENHPELGLKV